MERYANRNTVLMFPIVYRYTPQGLMYELVSRRPGRRWLVTADAISPLNGDSLMVQYNVMTGESKGETTAAAA